MLVPKKIHVDCPGHMFSKLFLVTVDAKETIDHSKYRANVSKYHHFQPKLDNDTCFMQIQVLNLNLL